MGLLTGRRVVDLTRILHPGSERFTLDLHTFFVEELLPDFKRPEGEWYILQEWAISSHIGTHVEAPYHHLREGGDVSTLAISSLMGEAVVLDFRGKGGGEAISLAEIRAKEDVVGPGDIVLIHTGCDRQYGQPNYSRPYLSLEAIYWLVEGGIAALGIDASGIEAYQAAEQPGHLLLFQHGIPIIEELTHLEELRSQRVTFIGLPLPLVGADSCPIRAVAVEDIPAE